jgi:hypothetical protein
MDSSTERSIYAWKFEKFKSGEVSGFDKLSIDNAGLITWQDFFYFDDLIRASNANYLKF